MGAFLLYNGVEIPAMGFGCYALDHPEQDILEAIRAGYRHFDTASFYQTEEALGRAIRESGVRRQTRSRRIFRQYFP